MIFTDLPVGATVFLDANTIVYHFSQHQRYGAPCTDLLERIARQERLVPRDAVDGEPRGHPPRVGRRSAASAGPTRGSPIGFAGTPRKFSN